MNQPVILCGLGRVGWRVLEYLQATEMPVVVVDSRCAENDPRLRNARLIVGDCRQREVLERAGLAQARAVLIVTSDDLLNVSTALMVRSLHAEVRIVVRMFNQNLLARLGKAVANVHALSVSALTAPLLALTALTGQALGAFGQGDETRQVVELTIDAAHPLLGRTIGESAKLHSFLPLAHLRPRGPDRILTELDGEVRLAVGDRLVICATPDAVLPLLAPEESEDVPAHWPGWLRRAIRILRRTFTEVDLSVKICTGVLLGVVAISTLVYYFGIDKSLPDALYRTVSVISTGADMHEQELASGWQKVFVSLLRIFGTAVTAAFTAIVTNYLIRARLRTALEIRRIPDRGHIVVCGLGNVGYRVVEELLRREESAVVIERQPDGRFVATARRLGVAVIVGDATVAEVLRQAHAATARAVVAVTDNELANLEIALLTRELNPRQRVVVRLSDAHLAHTLRDAANVRLALSIADMAAPAFVAALFGDRVQNIFLVGGRVLAAVELAVQAGDASLAGRTVGALTGDYRLLPVMVVTADGAMRTPATDQTLVPGDRLTALASLPDLARFLRREAAPATTLPA